MKRCGSPPRAVVFDFDGTLLNSLPLVLAAITHAVDGHGPEALNGDVRHPRRAARAFPPPDARRPSEPARVALERLMRFSTVRTRTSWNHSPGADAALSSRCSRAGARVALWTGRDRECQTQRLLGLRDWTERIFPPSCAVTTSVRTSPIPPGLLAILQRARGCRRRSAVFIGDCGRRCARWCRPRASDTADDSPRPRRGARRWRRRRIRLARRVAAGGIRRSCWAHDWRRRKFRKSAKIFRCRRARRECLLAAASQRNDPMAKKFSQTFRSAHLRSARSR